MSEEYSLNIFKRRSFIIIVLTLGLLFLIPVASSIGLRNVTFLDALKILLGVNSPEVDSITLWLRLRRVLVGVIVGGLLGGSGVIAQAVYRNPLASPFTLGISQAAALGVAVALLFGYAGRFYPFFYSISRPYLLPVMAFVFALLQSMLVLSLAYKAGLSPHALVLSSIALSFLYQSILALLQYLVLNELQVATIVFWTFGDLSRPGDMKLLILAIGFIPMLIAYMFIHIDLDLVSLGDDLSLASGINPRRFRLVAMIIASLGTSLATSFVGVLAFLCLLAPHIARGVVGASHKYLLPASILIGSILTVLADTLSRNILYPLTLPVGITLSFMGAPLLIYMLIRGISYGGYKSS
ncbi:MAG: iron ABC transporter permease [Desulfurococcaceae archaeon]